MSQAGDQYQKIQDVAAEEQVGVTKLEEDTDTPSNHPAPLQASLLYRVWGRCKIVWHQHARFIITACAVAVAVIPVVALLVDTRKWISGTQWYNVGSGVPTNDWSCTTNGSISLSGTGQRPIWTGPRPHTYSTAYLFQVSLGWGPIRSVKIAKGVDVAWNLVVGRGGQLLASIVAYRTAMQHISHAITYDSVSLDIFTRTTLNYGSLSDLGAHVRHTFERPDDTRFRQFIISFAVIISAAYVLSFSTLISAVASYQTVLAPFVPDLNALDIGLWVPCNLLTAAPPFLLRDGSRVGLSDNYAFSNDTAEGSDVLKYLLQLGYGSTTNIFACETQGCGRWSSGLQYQFNGFARITQPLHVPSNFTSPNGTMIRLDSPTLSVAYYANDSYIPLQYHNATYNATWIAQNGRCQPTGEYTWGFSAPGLLIFLCITAVFSLAQLVVWWSSMPSRGHERSPLRDIHAVALIHRTVSDHLGESYVARSARDIDASLKRVQPRVRY